MKRLLTALLLLSVLSTCDPANTPSSPNPPAPTQGDESDDRKRAARAAYEAQLHRAAPGTDWRALETENALVRHRKRRGRRGAKTAETFAGGLLTGEWFERGAGDIPGSVHDIAQDPADPDRLFVVSDGGSLWRLDYGSGNYTLVNQDIQIGTHYLGFATSPDGDHRLVGSLNDRVAYSTDYGVNWERATVSADGADVSNRLSSFFSPTVYRGQQLFTARLNDVRRIFASDDGGLSYRPFPQPPLAQGEVDQTITHLHAPPGTDRLFVATKHMYDDSARVSLYELTTDTLGEPAYHLLTNQPVETRSFFRGRTGGAYYPGTDSLRLYLTAEDHLWTSPDGGVTWEERPRLEKKPWANQALYVRPTDPDYVAYGEVELWISPDAGLTYEKANNWYDYYWDVSRNVHADIMNLTQIADPTTGEERLLVSSHGGINELDEASGDWLDLAPTGLYTAQYYDAVTNPADPTLIAAGSQDQGFQILTDDGPTPVLLAGEQLFSGDYGHLQWSPDGDWLFTSYPFGDLYAWRGWIAAGSGDDYFDTKVDSEDEFVWIAPTLLVPDPDTELGFRYYTAGGSAAGQAGSYLIEVTPVDDPLDPEFGTMRQTDLPYDFLEAAGGTLSALGASPLNPARYYAATTEGRFFASDDRGQTWEQTLNFLPEGWYLYGQAIHASRTEPETVWLAGSGYSNPAAWRSEDGGENFFPVSEGLPPTTIIDLAANPTESMLFAATEAGPFVYLAETGRWHDLTGDFAPTQRYTSVEWVEESQTARFATYGRGVWDFRVEELTDVAAPAAQDLYIKVYPNPATAVVTIEGEVAGYRIYDAGGQEVTRTTTEGMARARVHVSGWTAGTYFVQPTDAGGRGVGLARRLVVR